MDVYRARVLQADPLDGHEVLIDLDGEQPGRLPARFEVLPGALKIATGPECQQRFEELPE